MATGRAYIDIPMFQASAPGLFLAPFLGGNALLASPVSVGATSLTVNSGSGFQNGQILYLLDGPNSESILLTSSNGVSGNTLTVVSPGLAYAHSAGISVSSGGTAGALGQKILEASGWIENHCNQGTLTDRSLFSTTRAEKLRMPSMRAALDRASALNVAPLYFPVTAVSAVAVEFSPGVVINLDPTQVEISAEQKSFVVALLYLTNIPNQTPWTANYYLRRATQSWASFTYTAGLTWGNLPWDMVHAASLVVRDKVAQIENPTGAAMLRQEGVEVTQRLRGRDVESTADSIFMVQAKEALEPYTNKLM